MTTDGGFGCVELDNEEFISSNKGTLGAQVKADQLGLVREDDLELPGHKAPVTLYHAALPMTD